VGNLSLISIRKFVFDCGISVLHIFNLKMIERTFRDKKTMSLIPEFKLCQHVRNHGPNI